MRWLGFVCACLVALAPNMARADPPTGSRIDRSAPGLSGQHDPRRADSARPAVNVFLRCTASLDRSGAAKVLEQAFRSAEQIEAAEKFLPATTYSDSRREDCFSNLGNVEIGYDPVILVGAAAEFLVLDRFDEKDIAAISRLSKADWRQPGLMSAMRANRLRYAWRRRGPIWFGS